MPGEQTLQNIVQLRGEIMEGKNFVIVILVKNVVQLQPSWISICWHCKKVGTFLYVHYNRFNGITTKEIFLDAEDEV